MNTTPPLAELARQDGHEFLTVMNWRIDTHDGVKILDHLVLRERAISGAPQRYHVFRMVGRSTVPMYDVFEVPPDGKPKSEEDLKPVWPPGRDYNRPDPDV